ncbi:Hypothetical_protein [Hexamita inflata]|uniref:Hypothetical_protein n=1 Tax=Hexamita inflata TaxID=28002 RepID=A0AA86NFA4_9EUKA|nr:Hypothetical protein HINF_LOCUS6204 [Hexamita inflata]CAI9918572.1 Hypothetical protein HINF_LOCUS6217 [Hexamita inflata]
MSQYEKQYKLLTENAVMAQSENVFNKTFHKMLKASVDVQNNKVNIDQETILGTFVQTLDILFVISQTLEKNLSGQIKQLTADFTEAVKQSSLLQCDIIDLCRVFNIEKSKSGNCAEELQQLRCVFEQMQKKFELVDEAKITKVYQESEALKLSNASLSNQLKELQITLDLQMRSYEVLKKERMDQVFGLETLIQSLKLDSDSQQKQIQEQTDLNNSLQTQINEKNDLLSKQNAETEELREILKGAQELITNEQNQKQLELEESQTQQEHLKDQILNLQNSVDSLTLMQTNLEKQIQALQKKNQELEETKIGQFSANQDLTTRLTQLLFQQQELEGNLFKVSEQNVRLTTQNETLNEKNKEVEAKVAQLEEQTKQLQEYLQQQQEINKKLEETPDETQKQIHILQEQNKQLSQQNEDQKIEIQLQKQQITTLFQNYTPPVAQPAEQQIQQPQVSKNIGDFMKAFKKAVQ